MSITVLICVHSKSCLIDNLFKGALKSLVNQTYKDFSVVIVFDECWGWTQDKSFEQVKRLMREHDVSVVRKKKKTGAADAKNYGLKFVNTEWVAFLDADDEYMSDKLEKQVKFLKENKDIHILSTHYWWRDIKKVSNFIEFDHNDFSPLRDSCFKTDQYITHDDIKKRLPEENVLCHGSIIMDRNIFDFIPYDNSKEWIGKEDWKLWLDCMAGGYRFHQLPERLYVYTRNPNPVR